MKTRFCIIICLALIFTILTTSTFVNAESQKKQMSMGIFDSLKANSKVTIDYETEDVEEEFKPTQVNYINLNISYYIEGILAELYSNILKDKQQAIIQLSVEPNVDWAKTSIIPDMVTANITPQAENVHVQPKIFITLDQNAPARKQGSLTVTANVEEIKGPLNIFTYVLESENITQEISFTPAYVPIIDVKPDITFWEIPPLNITKIPVNITNKGNGKTVVIITKENTSEHFNVSIQDSILIDVDETKQVIIAVKPDTKFDQETLIIGFTPSYYADYNLTGSTVLETFLLKNDGSYKEKEEFKIDTNMLIILIIALVILIILALIIKRKKA